MKNDTDVEFFKPEDFEEARPTKIADIANRLLRKHGTVVWQTRTDRSKPGIHKLLSEWIEMDEWPSATHTALLINVQPTQRVDPTIKDLKLEGMSAEQVDFLKMFYESQTGKRAEDLFMREPGQLTRD